MIGSFLYGLQPQEAVSAPVLQWVSQFDQFVVQGQLPLFRAWQVPLDKAFVWTHAHLDARGGGLQVVHLAEVLLHFPEGGLCSIVFRWQHLLPDFGSLSEAQGQHRGNLLTQPLLIGPGYRILFGSNFDDSALANTMESTIGGILLPKGTLQLGQVPRLF